MRLRILRLAALATTIATSACGAGITPASMRVPFGERNGEPMVRMRIKHVVLMIQENRSFDDFFATFPGAVGATTGLMRTPHGDVRVTLKKAGLDSDSLGHEHFSFEKEYDHGKMDGFNQVQRALRHGEKIPAGMYAYRYVDPEQIQPYWFIAQHYVLADHMFTTQSSSSFTAHQDFVAGGTPVDGDNVIDFPNPATWGCNGRPGTTTNLITSTGKYLAGAGPFPCFTYTTLRDRLDAAGLSWLYFTNTSPSSYWNAFDAIKAVREGSQWSTNIVVPETRIFKYISQGQLPAISWVIPDAITSDHPGNHRDKGPSWVAAVINAVGKSAYWPSTLVIVVWDDWGGEYDNVPPPQLDGQGLGIRVPMLVISAYDREQHPKQPGYISHTQYEDGSILKFIENNWGLPRIGTTDVRANSIGDCFDFVHPPRAFVPIPAEYPKSFFEHMRPSGLPIDEY